MFSSSYIMDVKLKFPPPALFFLSLQLNELSQLHSSRNSSTPSCVRLKTFLFCVKTKLTSDECVQVTKNHCNWIFLSERLVWRNVGWTTASDTRMCFLVNKVCSLLLFTLNACWQLLYSLIVCGSTLKITSQIHIKLKIAVFFPICLVSFLYHLYISRVSNIRKNH